MNMKTAGVGSLALSELSAEYAGRVLAAQEELGPAPSYGFARDSRGRTITKRTRRTYRKKLLEMGGGGKLPSAFDGNQSPAYKQWIRRSWLSRIALTAGDAAIAAKYAFPDEYNWMRRTLPTQFSWLRNRLLIATRVRR